MGLMTGLIGAFSRTPASDNNAELEISLRQYLEILTSSGLSRVLGAEMLLPIELMIIISEEECEHIIS
jgi:hypothetical protein